MAELKSKTISAGDPVTSEIINNLVADLNAIKQSSAAQSIILQNTADASKSASVSNKVYSQAGISATIDPGAYPSGTVTFTFSDGWFTKAPRCWIQVNVKGQKLQEEQLRIHPTLFSVDTKKAVFYIRSGAGAKKATLSFDVFATEA